MKALALALKLSMMVVVKAKPIAPPPENVTFNGIQVTFNGEDVVY